METPPSNNVSRKECCHHFVQLAWGHIGAGVWRKVQDFVVNEFHLEFSASDGIYMGNQDSHAAWPFIQV
jgi:hypothetical protein